ncbi:MAG: hypothetical protein ACRDO7_13670, partial [Nocardioidaceae bacterium]
SRPSLLQKVPDTWRHRAVVVIAFVSGVAACGGAVLWWQARPTSPSFPADEHAVELLLLDAAPPRTPADGGSDVGSLHVDSAVFLSGVVTSTIVRVESPDESLDVRAPALPVTVSTTGRFQSVDLTIIVRDCTAATRWTPVDRPFTITWRDEYGKVHTDRAGDFDGSVGTSLVRSIDAACDTAAGR